MKSINTSRRYHRAICRNRKITNAISKPVRDSKAQFFIIAAVLIALVLMYFGFYFAGAPRIGIEASALQSSSAASYFENVREEAKGAVDISYAQYPSGGAISANLGRLKNFSENKSLEQSFNLSMSASNVSTRAFLNMSMSSRELNLRDELNYTGYVVYPRIQIDGLTRDWDALYNALDNFSIAPAQKGVAVVYPADYGDIIYCAVAQDSAPISRYYFRLDLQGTISSTYNYSVFIDSDSSTETGYRNGTAWSVGADYMINYTGTSAKLYNHTGGASSWTWTLLGSAEAGSGTGIKGDFIEFAIPKSNISSPSAMRVLFGSYNQSFDVQYYDFCPDAYTSAYLSVSDKP